MIQWYYFLMAVIAVVGAVTGFWKWYYGQKLITREEAIKLIDEKSFPRKNGEILESQIEHVDKKMDVVLSSQKTAEQNILKIEKMMSNEFHELKIEFTKLITEHNAFKNLHKRK